MMWRIRRWIYKRGWRPGRRSIFFSPTLHHTYLCEEAMNALYDRLSEET